MVLDDMRERVQKLAGEAARPKATGPAVFKEQHGSWCDWNRVSKVGGARKLMR